MPDDTVCWVTVWQMPFPFCHPTNNIKALKKHKVLTTKKKNQNDPLESVFHNPPIYEQW